MKESSVIVLLEVSPNLKKELYVIIALGPRNLRKKYLEFKILKKEMCTKGHVVKCTFGCMFLIAYTIFPQIVLQGY